MKYTKGGSVYYKSLQKCMSDRKKKSYYDQNAKKKIKT